MLERLAKQVTFQIKTIILAIKMAAKGGPKITELGTVTVGKYLKVPLIHTTALDCFGEIPQALAANVHGNYLIVVSTGWMNASQKTKDWVIQHEIGHIKKGHLRDAKKMMFVNLKRNYLPWTSREVLNMEQEADDHANKHADPEGGIEFFKIAIKHGFGNGEVQMRLKKTVEAYQQQSVINDFLESWAEENDTFLS